MSDLRRKRIFDKLGFSRFRSPEKVTLNTHASSQPLLETRASTASLAAPKGCVQRGLWDDICDQELAAAESDELKAAARRVRDDIERDRFTFLGEPSVLSPELKICQELLRAAEHKQANCKDEEWKSTSRGQVKLGHIYGSIAKSVQKLVSVGDVASQIDPLHFGVPWAAIRLALLLITNSHEHDALILEGLASSSRLIVRYAAFEEVYLRGMPPVDDALRLGLESSLEKLYRSLLLFLLNAQLFYSRDAASRFANGAFSVDRMKELLQDIFSHEIEIQRYESSALKQAANKQFLQTRELISQYNHRLRSEEREAILDWISTTDYRSPYLDIFKRVMLETGDWFFEKKEFIQWKTLPESSLLWLRGDAGTGKSSLMAKVINRLAPESLLDEGEVIAYFHCSRTSGHHEREDPECIIKCLLQQLASPIRGLPIKPPIIKKYKQDKDMGSRAVGLTLDQIENLALELIRDHYGHVTIVLDALDEIDIRRRARMFRFLKRLVQPQRTVVKLLISSRNEPDILGYFGGAENLYIEAKDNADDIRRYVVQEIGNHLLMGQAKNALKAKVEDVLSKKANGMFRWVELQVAAICDARYVYCAEDVEEALKKLPPTLEATYSRIIERLGRSGSTTRVVMETTLKLLICAEDSMCLKIIQEASSICQDNPIDQLRKSQIIRMSQSLIVFDEESGIFRFAHLSVREFLENDERFSADASHAIAAELCLRCLLYGNNYVDQIGNVAVANKDNEASKKNFLPELYKYALLNWPTHCAKAKQRRLSGRLQYLLYRFLGICDEKSYYTHWIDELIRARWWGGRIREKNDSCHSSPPHAIFFICTHGFSELLPQIEQTYSNSLDMENHMGSTPIEVAAYYGHLTTVQVLIGLRNSFPNPITWIDSACLCAAAGSPNVEVIEYLMSQTSSAKIDDDLVCAAALNRHCSVRMLETILAKAPQFVTTNSILRKVGRGCQKADRLQILLSRMQTRELDDETMVAACHNTDILRLFLGHCDQFELTEDFMVRATEEIQGSDCEEILDILCSNGRTYSVTSRLLKAAASRHFYADDLMSVFLPRYESDAIGEDVFQATVRNEYCGVDVLKMLTDRFQLPRVTEQLLWTAVGNSRLGTEILEVLLSFPNQIKRPEEAIYLAITSCSFVEPVQIAFLRRRFPTAEVTDSLIMTAVSNPNLIPSLLEAILSSPHAVVVNELMLERAAYVQRWKTMKILLQNAPDCSITERILLAAAQSPVTGFEVLKMLIILPGVTPMGNDSMIAILKNRQTDSRVVKLLFEKQNIIPVSAHLLAAACGTGLGTLNYLLERGNKDKASFFKSLLQQPNQVRWSELAHSVAKVLVQYLNEENVTQELWKDLAARESRVPMKGLLSRIEPTNYQDLLDAAAGNNAHGYDLVKYLLSIGKVAVSKETFLAAARNRDSSSSPYSRHWDDDARIFWFLLQHCQPSAWCQEIALVAATNRRRGRQIVELMMRNSMHVTVNQELLQASATNPRLLDYLLCHPQDGVIDTTEIVKLAANGGSDGLEALLILIQSGWSVKITEETLKTVCRIEYGSECDWDDLVLSIPNRIKRLMEHPTAIITEEVIKESVKNQICGLQIVQTLMNCSKNQVSMSQAILELSAQNEKSGYELIKYIFDDYASNVKVTKTLLALANKNFGCRQEILEFLLNRACIQGDIELIEQNIAAIRDDPHGIAKAMFRAAYRGHTAAFKALMKIGTDVTHQLGSLGNVLHVASFAGQLQIVKILVPSASLLDVPGGQFRSPLLAALIQDRVDIATCLVDGGVSTETVDTMQRTILHRLIRSEKSHNITALLKLGASTEARDLQGYTALHHAVLGSSISNTAALLKASALTDVKDNFGWTPLHWAARKGDMKIAELLISAGANLHSSDSQGRTPLGVAVIFGQDKLQKTLWTEAGIKTLELEQGLYADGIKCDACELDIYGDQYTCNTCEGFGLCYRCVVDAALIHDSEHVFAVL